MEPKGSENDCSRCLNMEDKTVDCWSQNMVVEHHNPLGMKDSVDDKPVVPRTIRMNHTLDRLPNKPAEHSPFHMQVQKLDFSDTSLTMNRMAYWRPYDRMTAQHFRIFDCDQQRWPTKREPSKVGLFLAIQKCRVNDDCSIQVRSNICHRHMANSLDYEDSLD